LPHGEGSTLVPIPQDISQRVEEYRRWAAVAMRRAERAMGPDLKRSYLNLAAGWTALADQIEENQEIGSLPREGPRDDTARRPDE